jgi:hypothetical protein
VFGKLMSHLVSVIICDLNIVGIPVDKPEADAQLVVNGDGVLPIPLPTKSVEPIAGRNPQII